MTSIGMASRVPHSVILVALMLGGCEFDESGGGVDASNAHGFGQPVRVGQVEVTVRRCSISTGCLVSLAVKSPQKERFLWR